MNELCDCYQQKEVLFTICSSHTRERDRKLTKKTLKFAKGFPDLVKNVPATVVRFDGYLNCVKYVVLHFVVPTDSLMIASAKSRNF